ncbi:hypothetical protein [Kribbella sp. DT2]|uniref:hypothetical protein n=1 Tax=Kribbella sp. DT2 TaxID=3393427 RepID=UPI003CFAAB55
MYRIVVAGLIVTAVAALTPVAFSHSEAGPGPQPIPAVIISKLPMGKSGGNQQPIPPPQIASAAIERAEQQMSSSEPFNAFLQGTSYTIKNQGYWTRQGSRTPIGLVREISLARPVDTSMRHWPVIVWRTDKNDYDQYAFNAQYKKVSSAVIYLDNEKGLVAITPGEGAVTIKGPGNKWIDSLPKEGGH